MDQSAFLPEEARATIAALIACMRRDEDERHRRWPDHPFLRDEAHACATADRLFVPLPGWFHQAMLDAEGRVILQLDADDEQARERPANALESHIVWQADVARTWPELGAHVPSRSADDVACPVCGGSGQLLPEHPNIRCACGNAGWVPSDAVGLEAFTDWPRFDGPPSTPTPLKARSLWRRWIEWFGF